MKLIEFPITVKREENDENSIDVLFYVDIRSEYNVLTTSDIETLKITPTGNEFFRTPFGKLEWRDTAEAYFSLDGKGGIAPVIFGLPGEDRRLGSLAATAMGFVFTKDLEDPLNTGDVKRGE